MPKRKLDDAAEIGPMFRRGPALIPADQLIAWLANQHRYGQPLLVRLPIVIPATDLGYDPHQSHIGSTPDALPIVADDSALGLSLEMHANKHGKGDPTCGFWVHGYFRGVVDGKYQLDVTKVESYIESESLTTADHAEVEDDSALAN